MGTANKKIHHIYWSSFWPYHDNIRHRVRHVDHSNYKSLRILCAGKSISPSSLYYLTHIFSHGFCYTSHRGVHRCGWMGRGWTSIGGGRNGSCSSFPLQIFNLLLKLCPDGEQLFKILMDWNLPGEERKGLLWLSCWVIISSQAMLPLFPSVAQWIQHLWISVHQYLGKVVFLVIWNETFQQTVPFWHHSWQETYWKDYQQMVLMGCQTYSNKYSCIPFQYHFQLNLKCLSQELSPACWDRTDFAKRAEFTKLAPYRASCYSSNQASFQESDPFQLVREKSAAAKWTVLVMDLPEPHSDKPFVEVDQVSDSAPDSARKALEMHLSASDVSAFFTLIWNTQLCHGQRKTQAILIFAAGSVISDKHKENSPSSKCHRKAKKVGP